MYELIMTIGVAVLYLLLFRLVGTTVLSFLGRRDIYIHRETVGFFACFAIFQFLYVPMVLLKAWFHLLAWGWLLTIVILVLICGIYLVTSGGEHPFKMPAGLPMDKEEIPDWLEKTIKWVVLLGSAAFVVFLVLQQYLGWDTAFYMGNMNEAIYTDTMYLYNGNDGTLMKHMDLRYALSGFSMQFTVPCYFLGISPVVMCYYGIRGIGAVLALFIVYDFGMLLFDKKETFAYILVGTFMAVNITFFSFSATSLFFIRRMNEAKGYCANVVLPMVALLLLMIVKKQGRHLWGLLFIICLGSVGASMSSMMLVPALLGLGAVVIAIDEKKFRPIFYGIVCALPNLAYVTIYILNVKKVLVFDI